MLGRGIPLGTAKIHQTRARTPRYLRPLDCIVGSLANANTSVDLNAGKRAATHKRQRRRRYVQPFTLQQRKQPYRREQQTKSKRTKKGARTRTKARIRTVRVTGKDRNTRRNEIYGAIKIEDGEKKRGGGSLLVLLLHDALQ